MRRSLFLLFVGVVSAAGVLTAPIPAGDAAAAVPWVGFEDVPPSNIFYNDIMWLRDEGITRGCNPPDNTLFCPKRAVTRGEMAAFLTRALGLTDPGPGDWFEDDDDSIFRNDIDRIAQAGITRGCNPPDNTEFCPDQAVTRQQMASFLVRALGLDQGAGLDWFEDDDRSVHQADIDRLRAAWITFGCNPPTENRYCPTDPVTREQMAAFLHRALPQPTPGPAIGIRGRLWPEVPYRWGDLVATFEIRAEGTEPLSDVWLRAPNHGPCTPDLVIPPVPLIGDDDALLEPGELWNGWCADTAKWGGPMEVDAVASSGGGATVSARSRIDFYVRHPLKMWVVTSDDEVPVGTAATWTLKVTNRSEVPITVHGANHWEGDWPWQPMAGPTHLEGDGDGILEIGDVWAYSASLVLFSPTTMQIQVGYDPVEVEGFTTWLEAPAVEIRVVYPDPEL